MISYYDLTEELKEQGLDELEKEIFVKTSEYLANIAETFRKEMFIAVSNDIEKWVGERIDNTKRYFFDAIVNHLLGVKYIHVDNDNKNKIDEFLSEIGHSAKSFRLKLYEENKEVILNALVQDAFYERVKLYENYFRSWDFKDITISYPQSSIVKSFLNKLIEKDGFDDYMKSILSKDIQKMKEQRDELKKELDDLERRIDEY